MVIHQTNFSVDGSSGNDLISYHTYFTNVFGNPEKAYHNSVGVRGASVYILGTAHLVISRLLPWKERVDVLRRGGDWMGAFNMAMSLFNGQAHGVVDLPKTVDAIREAIAPSLAELLLSYVDEVFSYISIAFSNQNEKNGVTQEPSSGTNNVHVEIEEQYNRVGGVAVEFCVHINRMDLLFDEIFSRFVAVQQRGIYFRSLCISINFFYLVLHFIKEPGSVSFPLYKCFKDVYYVRIVTSLCWYLLWVSVFLTYAIFHNTYTYVLCCIFA